MTSSRARTIVRLYVAKGLSRDKIADMLGLPHSAITNTLRKSGVKMRPPRTPIMVTELTFSKAHHLRIGSLEGRVVIRHQVRLNTKLAYSLGWIVGDGHANRREIDAIVSVRERKLIEPSVKAVLERFGKVLIVPRSGVHIIRCSSTKTCETPLLVHWTKVLEERGVHTRVPKIRSTIHCRSLGCGRWHLSRS
jgi:hypothetical protein